MKRLIVAVAIALSTTAALAEHRDSPFEQTELDRALPAVSENADNVLLAQTGGMSYKSAGESESVWATDHNFIAPPQ